MVDLGFEFLFGDQKTVLILFFSVHSLINLWLRSMIILSGFTKIVCFLVYFFNQELMDSAVYELIVAVLGSDFLFYNVKILNMLLFVYKLIRD